VARPNNAFRLFIRPARQGATLPLLNGHRMMGLSLMFTGDIARGRAHLEEPAGQPACARREDNGAWLSDGARA